MNLLASMRYLVALDQYKHFGQAARACHITQPALSNAMRALEAEFDVVIVKRGRTYAGLTPEGEHVLAAAQRMLHEQDLLQQELRSKVNQPRGPLRMGAVPTALPILARFAGMLRSRYPGIVPVVLSMSSSELEARLESLSLDLALGYTERMSHSASTLIAKSQYVEHYFLLQRAQSGASNGLKIGAKTSWKVAGQKPLALLTNDMHNRSIIESIFLTAGVAIMPALETNNILTLALSVVAGDVCSVMPGALVDVVRDYPGLEALPLVSPDVKTPIGFMTPSRVRGSRALDAALALASDGAWLRHAATHSGLLVV